jgi:hypothetical protein
MWFHLFTGNHDQTGASTLFDMMEWLTAGLKELKHEVTIGDTIAPNAMNVIWENFHDSDERLFKEHRFKFGLIATEIPVGRTFNWLDYDPWLTRRRCFDRIAPRASFIWSMMEEPVETYRQWAPSGFLELGFSEKIVDPVFSREPEFDFGFYGLSIAPRRNQVLQHLKKHFRIMTPDRFLKGRELNSFIASFKVGICLKHMSHWPVSSPARLSRILHAKRGIAAEYTPVKSGASRFVPMAERDQDFADFCLECIRGPWKLRAEEAYERFRAAMPMKSILERLRDWVRFHASEPQLVDSRGEFNFVRYKDRVYAFRQSLGHLDVAVEANTLVDRFGPNAVVVADTIEDARARVEALSHSLLGGE